MYGYRTTACRNPKIEILMLHAYEKNLERELELPFYPPDSSLVVSQLTRESAAEGRAEVMGRRKEGRLSLSFSSFPSPPSVALLSFRVYPSLASPASSLES